MPDDIANQEPLPEAPEAWICTECDMRCGTPLVADNPFEPLNIIYGCPHCKTPESLQKACVVDGCTRIPTMGKPGSHGYRYAWTCSQHHEDHTK